MPGKLDSLQGLATTLIADFGKSATLRNVARTYSATTGKTTEVVTDTSLYATPPTPFAKFRLGDDTIRTEDLSTMIKGAGVTPIVGDRLIYAGVEYQVIAVRPQYAGTVVAFYELQLRV